MARIEAIEERLLNWARWLDSSGSGLLGYASVNYERVEATRDRYREATIPITDDEARQTDEAVRALGEPFTRTLVVVYVTGRSQAHNERELGCGASTIKARVWESHRRLSMWFTERAAVAREHQARLQAMQQAARP